MATEPAHGAEYLPQLAVFDRELVETLGLQLVRMLAKQLGGIVTFDSAPESRVEVLVPMPETA